MKNYITQNGFESLKNQLRKLRDVERPKVVETVAWAASNGDRSENADYIYGKRRLREIDYQIRHLTQKLESAEIVTQIEKNPKSVVFGVFVKIEYEEGEQHTYHIVGEDEIDTENNKISWKSPIAKALLGKKTGETVLVKKPKGESWITILEIFT